MKSLLYFLFGLAIFTEISMTMRVIYGLENLDLPYISAMIIIAASGYYCLKKGRSIDNGNSKIVSQPIRKGAFVTIMNAPIETVQTQEQPNTDYLLKADIDKNILQQDKESIKRYEESLIDPGLNEDFKDIISHFLIPYKISLVKYKFNRKYRELQSFHYMINEAPSKYVSPSLIEISKSNKFRVMGYPDFFYTAFPDVIIWAVTDGWAKVQEGLSSFKREMEELTPQTYNPFILKIIIDLYLKTTNLDLECQMIVVND